MKFKLFFLVLFYLFTDTLLAVNKDSLQLWLKNNSQPDTNRVIALKSLAYIALFEEGDIENAISISNEAIEVAKKIPSNKYIAKMYSLQAYIKSNFTSDYEGSINSYYTALNYYEKLDDLNGILEVCINLGVTFYNYKQLNDAETYFIRAEKCAVKLNYLEDLASIYSNLGSVYTSENKDSLAFYYFNKAREHYIKTNDELNLASADYGLATIVVKDNKEISDKKRNEIIQVFLRVKEIFYKNETFNYYLPCIITLGSELTKQGELVEAYKYLLEAKKIAADLNDYNLLVNTYEKLALNANLRGNFKEEAEYLRLFVNGNDSLFRQGKAKAIADVQIKYETDKKEAENKLLIQQGMIKDVELKQSKTVRVALIGGLSLTFLFIILIFNRFKTTQKQKKIIEGQKYLVEEKQKEITDSIKYAKRIQEAILPPVNLIEKLLPESFFLYQPKDIVSGDFYWVEEIDGNILCAAVDCTGHGVPGAFMSIVGNNLLAQAVNEHHLTRPAEILDYLNVGVNQTLRQSYEDSKVRDGMDIVLCSVDFSNLLLQYAGANNPLWMIRNSELMEVKPDKQPIGSFLGEELKPFTNKEISLQKYDVIYIFSDGYADQFGGPKGKKFKYAQLKELLLEIHQKPMEEQKHILHKTIEDWKGNLEQVDDILVIGIRV